MGRTACAEPQCLYTGALYLTSVPVQGCTLPYLSASTRVHFTLLYFYLAPSQERRPLSSTAIQLCTHCFCSQFISRLLSILNFISLFQLYFYRVEPFLRRPCIKSEKCLVVSSCPSVRLSTCNSASRTIRISKEFYNRDFYKYLLRNSRFG